MKVKVITSSKIIKNIPCYTAKAVGSRKALLLFPEAFGFTGHIQDVALRLAREGFNVYVPQLYYKQGRAFDFTIGYGDKATREKLLQCLKSENFEEDFRSLQDYFSQYDSLFSIGFSIGGYFSFLAASVLKIDKLVAYYPNPTSSNLNYSLQKVDKYLSLAPSLVFFGGLDHSIPLSEIDSFKQAGCSTVVYPNAQHGFFCNSRHTYHKIDASFSWSQVLEFLGVVL